MRAMRLALPLCLTAALLACKRSPPASQPPAPTSRRATSPPAPASQPAASRPSRPQPAAGVPLADRGIFSELADRVRLRSPDWLDVGPALVLRTEKPPAELLYVAGSPVAFEGRRDRRWPVLSVERLDRAHDHDGDGIPDALDLLLGAKKAALNGAAYVEGYRSIPYPGGDVPRTEGVCTDVIIRALRNAGIDLQRLVHEDIRRAPRAYPMVRRPDRSIDHRRVRTLLPYFKRHWRELPADGAAEPLLPGDLVFLNTLGDARPDHLGIISDRRGSSGRPLVINNWTVGYRTAEMDLLRAVPVTHRFRLGRPPLPLAAAERGPDGLLRRRGLGPVEAGHAQLVLVSVPLWTSSGGELRRYRRERGRWLRVGRAAPVRLGAAGLGRGRGLRGAGALADGPSKREGDRRSPAGLFALGTALGQGQRPYSGPWPYRATDGRDRLVDDPRSPHYNTWQRAPREGRAPWRSAEDLSSYRLALRVLHNTDPVEPGAGSAIFLHLHDAQRGPTVGCTALERRDLVELLGWLRPAARPVLAQLPGVVLE